MLGNYLEVTSHESRGRDGDLSSLLVGQHALFLTPKSALRFKAADQTVALGVANRVTSAIENTQLCQELRLADQRKDEFLATQAHELRNFLSPIRNSLQIMRLAGDNKLAVEHSLGVIERQVEQMTKLVDDLMDVSRISNNKLILRKKPVQLAALIERAVEMSSPLIQQSGHELTVTLPSAPVYLDADECRLAQAISNLLNNSAKYTERGGHIWLTAALLGGDVIMCVRDTGVGIAAEAISHLFEMFAQVGSTLDLSQGGLGIGLTLVRRLVELHGGGVEARSDGVGRGSEFVVTLPVMAGDSWRAGPQASLDEKPPPFSRAAPLTKGK